METAGQSSLFELSLDLESIDHLTETARWGKFLAVAGFVMCGLMVVMSFAVGAIVSSTLFSSFPRSANQVGPNVFGFFGGAMIVGIYSIFAMVYFFPCLFLYKFSVRMRAALLTNEQVKLNQSLKAQKYLFRYVGIVTIVGLALGVVEIVIVGAVGLMTVFRH